jgi:hypothetical protein
MYNPATQVQVPTDANLGSYFQKTKNRCRGFPYCISFKKKRMERWSTPATSALLALHRGQKQLPPRQENGEVEQRGGGRDGAFSHVAPDAYHRPPKIIEMFIEHMLYNYK